LGYPEDVFRRLQGEFAALALQLGFTDVVSIPISALAGGNVVTSTDRMPWYTGPSLLQHLEMVPLRWAAAGQPVRIPVQCVIRPDASFRGFAGQIASGSIRPGDAVMALPSKQKSRVRSIVTRDGDESEVFAPSSVTLTLEDEIDVSRGDMLVSPERPPSVSRNVAAMVVWFNEQPMEVGRNYLVKHSVRSLRAKPTRIRFRVNMNTLEQESAERLAMNDVACVEFEAAAPLFFDPYASNRTTGSFILIDPLSNATVGAAMIQGEVRGRAGDVSGVEEAQSAAVSPRERYARHGHAPAIVLAGGRAGLAEHLERALFAEGYQAALISAELGGDHLESIAIFSWSLGLVLIVAGEAIGQGTRSRLEAQAGERLFDLSQRILPVDDGEAVGIVLASLRPERADATGEANQR
jgi:bifunctional enzyme CysN/CysC